MHSDKSSIEQMKTLQGEKSDTSVLQKYGSIAFPPSGTRFHKFCSIEESGGVVSLTLL